MSNVLKVQRYASGAEVRAWALENGYQVGAERGRIPYATAKAFNRVHNNKYVPGKFKAVREVVAKDARGKKVTRKVNPADVRALLVANGEQVGKRGRLSTSQIARALELAK